MYEIALFLLGILIGAIGVYLALRNRKPYEQHGVAAHVEKQQSEKQVRKEKILEMIREKGTITNNDVEKLLNIADATATNYLQELEYEGLIEQIGTQGRFVHYKIH